MNHPSSSFQLAIVCSPLSAVACCLRQKVEMRHPVRHSSVSFPMPFSRHKLRDARFVLFFFFFFSSSYAEHVQSKKKQKRMIGDHHITFDVPIEACFGVPSLLFFLLLLLCRQASIVRSRLSLLVSAKKKKKNRRNCSSLFFFFHSGV